MESWYWKGLRNDKELTELPHYAINESLPEDSYYTKPEIAKHCVDKFFEVIKDKGLDISNYTFIEPSAGEGGFCKELPEGTKIKALDLYPKAEDIEQADFLQWYPQKETNNIVIGNPPFGVRGSLAMAFVKRAFQFSDYVAFILPMSFYSNGKGSNMKRIDEAELIYSEELDPAAFYLADTGKDMTVRTVFQVWKKGEAKKVFDDFDVSEYVDIWTCCSAPNRYCGLGKGRDYDLFIASTFYGEISTVDNFDDVKYGSGYGIIIKKDKERVREILENVKWSDYASNATNSCRHIRMNTIRQALGKNNIGEQK